MPIAYREEDRTFHLQTPASSYIMRVEKGGYLAHLYWGRRLGENAYANPSVYWGRSSISPTPLPGEPTIRLDTLPQEYPSYGTGDFRHPAYQARLENGSTAGELVYHSHRIFPGKPPLEGLPATYVEADKEASTLEIELKDSVAGLTVMLSYTVFEQQDAITRSVRFLNEGGQPLRLWRALSMSVDFAHSDFDMIRLPGSWARERDVVRTPLGGGMQSIESRRGVSSHTMNPFLCLASRGAGEDHGEVYGFSLVYSGSFAAFAEVDQFRTTRVSMGINPFDFEWKLDPGAAFQTPEVVAVFSAEGLGGMSRTYHRLYRSRLCRGNYRDAERPIKVNNWEATYFRFDDRKLEEIADAAAEAGIELFVLDDGWFGRRNDDKSSLGDWFVNREKLRGGLEGLAASLNRKGLKFGLWFEPEMVSPDSELYRKHPDWCLHVPGRRRTLGRNQLILDYSREDVCEEILRMLTAILESAPIEYVKWDFNRNMTEIGSELLPAERQRETAHRYMLGLYRVLERLVSRFPHILFESCAGGGGRFDPGMLYYMPQTWTSDNTDAVSRLRIQYGTSLVYPPCSMGAHVSAVPNHQVGRVTPLASRGHVAMSGILGYELDLSSLSGEEKDMIKKQAALYKEIRPLIQYGDFYRILNPFEGTEASWMFVDANRSRAVFVYANSLLEGGQPIRFVRLKGLDPRRQYRIEETGTIHGGDELMFGGVQLPRLKGDYPSLLWRLTAVNQG